MAFLDNIKTAENIKYMERQTPIINCSMCGRFANIEKCSIETIESGSYENAECEYLYICPKCKESSKV